MGKQKSAAPNDWSEGQRKTLLTEIQQRSTYEAVNRPKKKPADLIAKLLLDPNPGTVQDLLKEFPSKIAGQIVRAILSEYGKQWLRNQSNRDSSIGRFMDPAIAVFDPDLTVADSIN